MSNTLLEDCKIIDPPAEPARPLPSVRSWLDVQPSPATDVLIGPGPWVSRGAGVFVIAPSGAGKSTWTATQSFAWAVGRESLGFIPTQPLKSLIIQAEDDDRDLSDMRSGVVSALRLTSEERDLARHNVLVVTERSATGLPFLFDVVQPLLRSIRPDILWLNPVSAYFGNDLNDQQAVAQFFRNTLNPIVAESKCAVFPVHHVPKPNKDRDGWAGNQLSYAGAGSADLSNWSRETIVLRETAPGLYEMTCTKRWRKLGWVDLDGKPTGTRRIAYGAGGEQYWRDATPDILTELGARPYSDAAMLELVPVDGIDRTELIRRVAETFSVTERTSVKYVNDARRECRRMANGSPHRSALLAVKERPRSEVYPSQPRGRPVVWLTRIKPVSETS
jgi:hypothetical protein